MIDWILEVEEVVCPVDDMKKMYVFTFLRSESERWSGGKRTRVQGGARLSTDGGLRGYGRYGIIESRLFFTTAVCAVQNHNDTIT